MSDYWGNEQEQQEPVSTNYGYKQESFSKQNGQEEDNNQNIPIKTSNIQNIIYQAIEQSVVLQSELENILNTSTDKIDNTQVLRLIESHLGFNSSLSETDKEEILNRVTVNDILTIAQRIIDTKNQEKQDKLPLIDINDFFTNDNENSTFQNSNIPPTSQEEQQQLETSNLTAGGNGFYEDEKLYEYLKKYRELATEWDQSWFEKINTYTKEKKAYPIDFLKRLIPFLESMKKAGNDYLNQYEALKEDISPGMKDTFIKWKDAISESLPKWTEYIQQFKEAKGKIIANNKLKEEIENRIQKHRDFLSQYHSDIKPNIAALLVEKEDLATVEAMELNITALGKLISTSSSEAIKKAYDYWLVLSQKSSWKNIVNKTREGLTRTEERLNDSTPKDGNPELTNPSNAKKGPLQYISPNKKMPPYRKGPGDEKDIEANDVQQGDLNDCFVLAPIASLAKNAPEKIKEMIEEQDDGSFIVNLHIRKDRNSTERILEKVVVSREFVVDQYGNDAYAGKGDRELWVKILEKAIADVRGGYDGLDFGIPIEIIEMLTGDTVSAEFIKPNKIEETWQVLIDALNDKKILTLSSNQAPTPQIKKYTASDNQTIYYDHTYYLDKIEKDKVWINNPHGKEHIVLKKADLATYFSEYAKQN